AQLGENYSYTFDGEIGSLDHVMSSAQANTQVVDATIWHINTDEPEVLNYNEEFNPAGYYSTDVFRSSDHDAVIVGINFVDQNDLDGDGVSNENDQCPMTSETQNAGVYGCSDEQIQTLVDAECSYTNPGWEYIQSKCQVFYVRTLYGQDYMALPQALRLIVQYKMIR
ncbi:MAG: hypothetical protein SWL02_18400, partial [Pseudomonadota bacterium]|nr:hypothetical protein [Pseudomonadota bacterium]